MNAIFDWTKSPCTALHYSGVFNVFRHTEHFTPLITIPPATAVRTPLTQRPLTPQPCWGFSLTNRDEGHQTERDSKTSKEKVLKGGGVGILATRPLKALHMPNVTFTDSCTHRWRCQSCKATAGSSGVRRLARGHLDTRAWRSRGSN